MVELALFEPLVQLKFLSDELDLLKSVQICLFKEKVKHSLDLELYLRDAGIEWSNLFSYL